MCIIFQIALGYSNFEFGLYASLYYKGDYYNDNPNMQGYTWDFLANDQYGSANAVDNKVFLRKFIPKVTWGVYNDDLNVPLMRYADVLLMRAEALNENSSTAEAITLINMVRATHGKMPATTAVSQSEVKSADSLKAQIQQIGKQKELRGMAVE